MKCDRTHPCQNCTRRGQDGTCTFPESMVQKHVLQSSSSSKVRSMRQRVTRLERLLQSLIEPGGGGMSENHSPKITVNQGFNEETKAPGTIDCNERSYRDIDMNDENLSLDNICPSSGQLTLDNTETRYVSSTHWGAVLNEVRRCLPPGNRPNSIFTTVTNSL